MTEISRGIPVYSHDRTSLIGYANVDMATGRLVMSDSRLPEPSGLCAVVVDDATGMLWMRRYKGGVAEQGTAWQSVSRWNETTTYYRRWSEIRSPRVLSEGVTE